MRTIIERDVYLPEKPGRPWTKLGQWPCAWIACPDAGESPFVTAYRCRFSLSQAAQIRLHASADERYELYLDGELVGRGPERGDAENWFYETYDLPVSQGVHLLAARVWALGKMAPFAQMSVQPGFLLSPQAEYVELLGTGVAAWEAKRLEGIQFLDPAPAWGTGANLLVDGSRFSWGFELGYGKNWKPAITLKPATSLLSDYEYQPLRRMRPATLLAMFDQVVTTGKIRFVSAAESFDTTLIPIHANDHLPEEIGWDNLIHGRLSLTVPPYHTRRVIIDLENYYCAYPEIITSGGAGSRVRLLWAEVLFEEPEPRGPKGNRDEIENKYFIGVGDIFLPDGGNQRHFNTLWWQAGRYLELMVETGAESLTIERLILRETHYPVEMESAFSAAGERFNGIIPIMVRSIQMDAHETYMDCPYYEQLQYVGDTRLEILATYVMSRDDRLPRKALEMFAASRRADGLTQSRYPSRVVQIIPPFSLWWVGMLHDYALWRGDRAFIDQLMPVARGIIERFRLFIPEHGLLGVPYGWNFMDWVPGWDGGIPPEGSLGASGMINWQFVLVQLRLAELEDMLGNSLQADAGRLQAKLLAERVNLAFWDERRGLFADDLAKQHFTEHTQCLAILTDLLDQDRLKQVTSGLLQDGGLERTTVYFTHYLFEAYQKTGNIEAFFKRMQMWLDMPKIGLKTTFEMPEPSRSDCHAWGAHPLYHYFATILGIRPAGLGFKKVTITPLLGTLQHASGKLVHPDGEIEVDFHQDRFLHGTISLPAGVNGTLVCNGRSLRLNEGSQIFNSDRHRIISNGVLIKSGRWLCYDRWSEAFSFSFSPCG